MVPKEGCLADTLGDEPDGLVTVDFQGHPMQYNEMTVFSDVIAKQTCRIEVEIPRKSGGWRRAGSSLDTQDFQDLDDSWRDDLSNGARYLLEESHVKANDANYDAKCWPQAHPYGTGSLLAEPGSGGAQKLARNRASCIQSFFRRSALWAFWKLAV